MNISFGTNPRRRGAFSGQHNTIVWQGKPSGKIGLLFGAVFSLIGLPLLAVACYLFVVPAVPPEFVGTTSATITGIETERYRDSDNKMKTQHNVFIEYTVDDTLHKGQLDYYDFTMSEGQTITVNYDTRNPKVVFTPGSRLMAAAIVGVLGIVFFLVGIAIVVMASRKPPKLEAPNTDDPNSGQENGNA